MKTVILGFDPGFRGAMAVVDVDTMEAEVHDFPVNRVKKKTGNAVETTFDKKGISELLRLYRKDMPEINSDLNVVAQMEQVGCRAGQGRTSIWTFGFGVGLLTGILEAFNIPVLEAVTPQKWKSVVMEDYSYIIAEDRKQRKHSTLRDGELLELKRGRDKKIAHMELDRAKELFPKLADSLKLSKDGRTDALLISYYGACLLSARGDSFGIKV